MARTLRKTPSMKALKWIAIAVGSLFGLLIIVALLSPWLFGDKIRALADEQIAANVDAEVRYGDIDFSIFRSFPKLGVSIEDISVVGRGAFDSIRLADIEEVTVEVDFWSAIGEGPIQIHGVHLVRPALHVIVNRDGTTNTDIVKSTGEQTPAAESGTAPSIALEEYSITDGSLLYEDRAGDIYVDMKGLQHSGSGDFTAVTFDLDTETDIETITLTTTGIDYLYRASVDYDAVLAVNTEGGTVTLTDNALKINEMMLDMQGVVGLPDAKGNVTTDLSFAAPKQDFRALWSVVPAAFAKTLDGVKTAGNFDVSGTIEGTYVAETGGLPGFDIELGVQNGSVKYPDLPKDLRDINVDARVTSRGGALSDLLVDVPRFSFGLGSNPFSGSLKVRNGTTDPAFDLVAKGRLDLADLSQAIPLEGVTTLAGLIDMDVTAKGTASGATSGDVRAIDATGTARFERIEYVADGIPAVQLASGTANFDGNQVTLTDFVGKAGKSDFVASGTLVDPFSLASETGKLGGNLNLRSRYFDANEWLVEPTTTSSTTGAVADATIAARPFDRFDLDYVASIDRLLYDIYDLTDVKAQGNVTSDVLTISSSSLNTAGSDVAMSGRLANLYGYTFDGGELTGDLDLRSRRLDLLALSSIGVDPNAPAPTAADAAQAEYIPLPERMSINVKANVGEMLYDDITLRNVTGSVAMANQKAAIQDASGDLLGGKVKIDGGYTYRGESVAPTFDVKYALQKIGFKEAFEQFNTIQQLAPVAKYLTGSFNTDMVLSSTLGRDMMPVLKELNADGFINTISASLEGFAPLQKAATLLGVKELQNLSLKDTKNWFTIADGLVTVQPFEASLGGINATIGGKHGLDQAMDYDIVAVIPRKLLGNNVAGAAANKGIGLLNDQASKLGVNLAVGENVRVRIKLTGSITDPKVDFKLLGTEGEGTVKDAALASVKDIAKQAKDSLERVAQARLDAARGQAEAKARAVTDSVRSVAEARVQALADEAKAKASAEARKLADQATARAGEEAKRLAEEAARKQGADAVDKGKEALKGLLKKKPD